MTVLNAKQMSSIGTKKYSVECLIYVFYISFKKLVYLAQKYSVECQEDGIYSFPKYIVKCQQMLSIVLKITV